MRQTLHYRQWLLFSFAVFICCTQTSAQVKKTTFHFGPPVVVNFHDLAAYEKSHPVILKPRYVEQGEDRDNFIFHPLPVDAGAKVNKVEPKSLNTAPAATSPSPSQNFAGVESNNTEIPPDINGAAGTTYVIETTNQQFNIYTKSTGALKSTLAISTLFSPSNLFNYYDPHVTYDPNNDRFLIGIDANTGSSESSPSAFGLAVSATGDPTGSWYIYSVVCTPSAPTDFMDYDQLGFNNNWIVMTGNDFPASGSNSSHIYVWPRATLYAGTSGTATAFTDATNLLQSPASTYDASQNTEYLVSDRNGNSSGNGFVNIATITGTASAPVYSSGSQLGINQTWQDPTALEHAPESGETAAKGAEAGDTRIHSCIYRNSSLWFTHTVFLPASGTVTNSAVDWWQVNPSALTVTQFDRLADANKLIWYYYSSLDVNANGDMLIGYSNSSSTTFCGAQYSLHLATDAINTLETPVQFVNGLAGYYQTYGGGRNRWGDFSGTAFDPSDGSFWTFQEWANTGNLWATQVAHIPDGSGTSCGTPTGLNASSITSSGAVAGWSAVTGANTYNLEYGTSLTSLTTVSSITNNTYTLNSLSASTKYYFEVQTVCSGGNSTYSTVDSFTTAAAAGCGTPTGLNASSITTTGATAGWSAVSGANSYNLEYGTSLTSLTTVSSITNNSYQLTGLTANTKYYFEVQTACTGSNSAYSTIDSFTTSAVVVTYCASKGTSTGEYISKVVLSSINNTSSNDGGYGNFTSVNTNLTAGTQYTVTLTPAFKSKTYAEFWTVYIDYNQDGTLNGTGETVATGKEKVTQTSSSFTFTVPATAKNGATRLRIQLQRASASTNPCATITHGDVQDFTVTISGGATKPAEPVLTTEIVQEKKAESLSTLSIIPNPISGASYATAVYNLAKDGNTTLQVIDINGRLMYTQNLGVQNAGPHNFLLNNLTGKLVSGYYFVVLQQNSQVVARNRFIVTK